MFLFDISWVKSIEMGRNMMDVDEACCYFLDWDPKKVWKIWIIDIKVISRQDKTTRKL